MKSLNQLLVPILVSVTLIISVFSCVMVFEVADSIEELEEEDAKIMAELRSDLNPVDTVPVLSDTIAFYKTEERLIEVDYSTNYRFTIHRYFFMRAKYTDSLYNGFNIIVADIDNKGIVVERQENVTLSQTNLGEETSDWQYSLDTLTMNKDPYTDFSDKGLKVRTYIRTNKY